MTAQDINPMIAQLAGLFAGNKLSIRTDPNASAVEISLVGIPLEISIPAVVNLLTDLMEYSVNTYKEQAEQTEQKKEVPENGISNRSGSSCEISDR